jgi:nitrogen fixation NifU-like protein
MVDLRELYQEVILDHNRNPRNKRLVESPTGRAEGHNPLCGDNVTITIRTRDGKVEDVGFDGAGCAVSTASASLMTEAIKGKSIREAEELFRRFQGVVTGVEEDSMVELGDLEVLAGVKAYPVRIKCATLPWHTLHAALLGSSEPITTE